MARHLRPLVTEAIKNACSNRSIPLMFCSCFDSISILQLRVETKTRALEHGDVRALENPLNTEEYARVMTSNERNHVQ